MREQCKHYESRTYPNGDSVRRCSLDLAPEAPWRCPENCPSYQPRLADVAWTHGSLVSAPVPAEPDAQGIAELFDAAEEIVNAAAPSVFAEVERERQREQSFFGRLRARFRRS